MKKTVQLILTLSLLFLPIYFVKADDQSFYYDFTDNLDTSYWSVDSGSNYSISNGVLNLGGTDFDSVITAKFNRQNPVGCEFKAKVYFGNSYNSSNDVFIRDNKPITNYLVESEYRTSWDTLASVNGYNSDNYSYRTAVSGVNFNNSQDWWTVGFKVNSSSNVSFKWGNHNDYGSIVNSTLPHNFEFNSTATYPFLFGFKSRSTSGDNNQLKIDWVSITCPLPICYSYTYSNWGDCINSIQSRILTGCYYEENGNYILDETCNLCNPSTADLTQTCLSPSKFDTWWSQPVNSYPYEIYKNVYSQSNYPFILNYDTPNDYEYNNSILKIWWYPDNTFNINNRIEIANNKPVILDSDKTNAIQILKNVSENETGCFLTQFTKSDQSVVNPYAGVLCYIGNQASSTPPILYSDDDEIAPDRNLPNQLFYILKNKVPLYYFYQAKSLLQSQSLGNALVPDYSVKIPFHAGDINNQITIPVFLFSDPKIIEMLSDIRPVINYALWFTFLIFIIFRFSKFEL